MDEKVINDIINMAFDTSDTNAEELHFSTGITLFIKILRRKFIISSWRRRVQYLK
jgi:hypothetical protein